jgi:hypothetical protein
MPRVRKVCAMELLSGTGFVAGVQCSKRLWLAFHGPDQPPGRRDSRRARFERDVLYLARKAFPGGVTVELGSGEHLQAVASTRELMARKGIPAIFEGGFTYEGIKVRVNVLERRPAERWRLIEVRPTEAVEKVFLYELALAKYVLDGCGYPVEAACVMHLAPGYDYRPGGNNHEGAFRLVDLTHRLRDICSDIPQLIYQAWLVLDLAEPPDIRAGPQCMDPEPCPYRSECGEP